MSCAIRLLVAISCIGSGMFSLATVAHSEAAVLGSELVISSTKLEPGRSVFLASDLQRWNSTRTKMVEVRPGVYEARLPMPWASQILYKFVVDGNWIEDQDNSDSVDDGHGGGNSRFLLPGEPHKPELQPQSNHSAWVRSETSLNDRSGRSRKIVLFSPPQELLKNRGPITTVYLQDGGDYELQTGLQHLAANRGAVATGTAPLMRLIMIAPIDRMNEYFLSRDYADWIHFDLIRHIERVTGITDSPSRRVIVGASLGGLAAIYHASIWPGDFGRVVAQSPSLQLLEDDQRQQLIDRLKQNSQQIIAAGTVFNLSAGVYETRELHDTANSFLNTLNQFSPGNFFKAYPCQHNWACWNLQLPDIFL